MQRTPARAPSQPASPLPEGLPPTYRLSFHAPSSSLAPYGRSVTFNLQAQNAKTGAVLARAICSTSRDGSVSELSAVPLDAKDSLQRHGF
jgi:hypothetical protein